MIFLKEPSGFNPKFEVVSCFLECAGKILLLLRSSNVEQGGTWGVPAGKLEKGETSKEAVVREIYEETSFITQKVTVKYFRSIFVRYPSYDFKYHMYSLILENEPKIIIDGKSHTEFRWVKPNDALKLNLIQDEDSCIKMFYNLE